MIPWVDFNPGDFFVYAGVAAQLVSLGKTRRVVDVAHVLCYVKTWKTILQVNQIYGVAHET
jgi:sorbitol-specific phosphotransferase system component IIC